MQARFHQVRSSLLALAIPLVACGSPDGAAGTEDVEQAGSELAAPCKNTGAYATNDPRSVCHSVCTSATSSSDVRVEISQTALSSAKFTATVKQTKPASDKFKLRHVTASWSGNFFNFFDATTLPLWQGKHLKFHELVAVGALPNNANVELYTDDNTLGGGPINAGPLYCTLERN